MKFFLIEDDEYKRDVIVGCLNEAFDDTGFIYAKSVTSAVRLIEILDEDYIVLLDMSLPTYDLDSTSGGRPQGFGGVEILRNMEFYEKRNKVIVITQYESIRLGRRVLDSKELVSELNEEFSSFFVSLINFNVVSDDWKKILIYNVEKVLYDKSNNS